MFTISESQQGRPGRLFNRRAFLQVGGLGLGGLTLANLLAAEAKAGEKSITTGKSVVLLFLQGGPPQVETFNPIMEAPANTRSCIGEVKTQLPGITFGSAFPKLGQMAKKISVVRSFASGDGGHNQLPVLTGNSPLEATMGAQFAKLAGANHPRTAMPTHTVVLPEQVKPGLKLGEPTGPFSYGYIKQNYPAAGSLGSSSSGVLLDGGEGLTGDLTLNLPRGRFDDRRTLLAELDSMKRGLDRTGELHSAQASNVQAFEVLTRGIAEAFDLSREDARTVARYDTSGLFRMEDYHRGGKHYNNLRNQSRITNQLGKQMLLARRLCEAGCGFVTVVDGCWDFHGDGNNPPTPVGMPVLGPQVDHAVAAFLQDLEDRGLSDDILLIVTGEMGRSPNKNNKNGGTGHWGRLTPLLVAGGGLNMGQVIGRTDRNGGEATSQQYLPKHLLATVMQTLFNPAETRLVAGLPRELETTITSGEPIRELMKS